MVATDSARDWARYWRADGVPVEAMHAHFTSHVYHRHSHESYSFGVTETGAQTFTCRNGRHVSGAGMIMAFNPDDPLTARSLRDLHLALTGCGAGSSELERYERLTATARLLVRHSAAGARAADPVEASGPDTRVAARIREILHDRYAAPDRTAPDLTAPDLTAPDLTGTDLAAAAGCSRFTAYRAFRQVYGLAPSDYQRQLRVRAARRLLARDMPPAAAAAATGFADQAHLTRWFRRYYGVTPGAYRAAMHPQPGAAG